MNTGKVWEITAPGSVAVNVRSVLCERWLSSGVTCVLAVVLGCSLRTLELFCRRLSVVGLNAHNALYSPGGSSR